MRVRVPLKPLVLVAVVTVVVVAALLGAFDPLRDQNRVEGFLTDAGPWGPALYVSGFTTLQPLSLPGAVLILPATFVWSAWTVLALSWLGGMIASTIGFFLARWLGRDWVDQRLPDRYRRWDDRLASHGLRHTLLLRLVTGLAPPADWLLGVSAVRIPAFFAGTAIGLLPGIAIGAFVGDDALRLLDRRWAQAAAVGLAATVVGTIVWRRLRGR